MNKQFRTALKGTARQVLIGKWTFFIGAFLLQLMIHIFLQQILGFAFPFTSSGSLSVPYLICMVIVGLLMEILSTGSIVLYLNACRGYQYRITDLFYGFTHQPERVAVWFLFTLAIAFGFFLVPVLLLTSVLFTQSSFHPVLLAAVWFLFSGALYCFLLRYAMFPFLYVDAPWKPARELLRESRELMKGQKRNYFFLQVSFIGLEPLCILTFGIGVMWLHPYITMTNTLFYLKLSENQYQP